MFYYKLLCRFFLPAIVYIFSISTVSATVITSIKPLAFITSAITEGVTPSEVLLADGTSPHNYALKPSDIKRLNEAELIVWVGPDLERFLEKIVLQQDKTKQLTLIESVHIKPLLLKNREVNQEGEFIIHNNTSVKQDHDEHDTHKHDTHKHDTHKHDDHKHDDHDHGEFDSHIWLSPTIAKQIAIAVHQQLVEIRPQDKVKLDINLQLFIQELEKTEQNVDRIVKPVKDKRYFVFHDAYQYFEHDFDLQPLGYFTINPEVQPGARKLRQIKKQLTEQKAKCVFAEPQFRPAIINSITQGLNVTHGVIDPLGSNIELSKDSYHEFITGLALQISSCLKE